MIFPQPTILVSNEPCFFERTWRSMSRKNLMGHMCQKLSFMLNLPTKFTIFFFLNTLPKTNIAPENRPSQKETRIPTINFQVLLLVVSGGTIRWKH